MLAAVVVKLRCFYLSIPTLECGQTFEILKYNRRNLNESVSNKNYWDEINNHDSEQTENSQILKNLCLWYKSTNRAYLY